MDTREQLYTSIMTQLEGTVAGYERSAHASLMEVALLYTLIDGYMSQNLQVEGLSISGYNLLCILQQQESECLPLHEIGRLMVTSRANITGLVDQLSKRGLVERVPHPSDRRVKYARLCPRGRELLERQRPLQVEFKNRLAESLSEEERNTLCGLLRKWRYGLASSGLPRANQQGA